MAIASIGGYDMMGGVNAQSNMLKMMDMSALTNGTMSTADSATFSKMFGSDYTNYQNMLNSTSSAKVTGAGAVSSTGAGVGLTADGMFDFKSYFNTYFPNLSDEEVATLTEQYSKQYEALYAQMSRGMDMSNLAGLVTGMGGTSLDTDSILKQVSSANSQAGATFDVGDYLKTYFPDLSNKQVDSLANKYMAQYNDLTKS